MANYDLTKKILPNLDRQLVYPLLEFLSLKQVYREEDLLKAKYRTVMSTKMVDFAGQLHMQVHDVEELPEEFETRREAIRLQLEKQEKKTEQIRSLIENPEVAASLRQDRFHNMQLLADNYKCTDEMVKGLYTLGKLQFSCGNFGASADLLYHYSVLSTDAELTLGAMWGKLASEILLGNWESAFEDLGKLREFLDKLPYDSAALRLTQCTWLLHWSLFVFFNHPNGRDGVIDMFLQPQYTNTMQNASPWLVRYLVAAVVINRRRRNVMNELRAIIECTAHAYTDPLTEFVSALYIDFDFARSAAKLKECHAVLDKDFFLTGSADEFMESARMFIAETYCRVHRRIFLPNLIDMLDMPTEEAEKWLVRLIRESRMDAKIDFKESVITMNSTFVPPQQLISDKTKFLLSRSQILNGLMDKHEQSPPDATATAAATTAATT